MLQYKGRAMTQAGFSPRTPEFDPRSVHVGTMVDKVALGQVPIPVLRLSPVSVIAPMLHTHLDRHVCLTRGTNELSLGTSKKPVLFRKFGSIGYKSPLFFSYCLKSYAAICSSDPEVWLLPVSDYVKDRNCFQWKWREFLEKVWPRAGSIMLLCAMGSCVGSAFGY